MRKRSTIGSSKTPLSRQISRAIEKILRPYPKKKVLQAQRAQQLGAKDLAKAVGVEYQSLAYYLSARNNVPAFILPAVCKALKNYEPLNILEREAGRIAFEIPPLKEGITPVEDVKEIQKLVMEVGEALQKLGKTLEDGEVDDTELGPTIKELQDVTQECIRLEHWLKKKNRAYNKKQIGKVRTA